MKPIKHTPILKGKDALNFLARLKENKNKKVDRRHVDNIRNEAKKLQSILKQ